MMNNFTNNMPSTHHHFMYILQVQEEAYDVVKVYLNPFTDKNISCLHINQYL